jgi:hypothetical protein
MSPVRRHPLWAGNAHIPPAENVQFYKLLHHSYLGVALVVENIVDNSLFSVVVTGLAHSEAGLP